MKVKGNLFNNSVNSVVNPTLAGIAIGGGTGLFIGHKIGENIALEKAAENMGIKILNEHVPDIIDKKQIFKEGGIWYKKDNLILTVGDNPNVEIPSCNVENLDNCYVYQFEPKELLGDEWKKFIVKYSIGGSIIGMIAGAFLGGLVGTAIGLCLSNNENNSKNNNNAN